LQNGFADWGRRVFVAPCPGRKSFYAASFFMLTVFRKLWKTLLIKCLHIDICGGFADHTRAGMLANSPAHCRITHFLNSYSYKCQDLLDVLRFGFSLKLFGLDTLCTLDLWPEIS